MKKEKEFTGKVLNGFFMLCLNLVLCFGSIAGIIYASVYANTISSSEFILLFVSSILVQVVSLFLWAGFILLEPGEARVCVFFGEYRGTFSNTGFYWINPFVRAKKVSMRARNLEVKPIKVNDKMGNPVMIGLVLVWKLKDTYKAFFEIDSQTMAASSVENSEVQNLGHVMLAFENFVKVQSDAALRQVAGQYAYDNDEQSGDALTLRSGGEEINEQLETKLNERLAMAGIEVVEARLNYLAYAPEIAAVMLRRQQATAIISAREKIVEGAVSMVKLALRQIAEENIVELDEEKKAAMVSNLLVVLCADESAQPIVNAGTLNH